jgi:hypothetical protein
MSVETAAATPQILRTVASRGFEVDELLVREPLDYGLLARLGGSLRGLAEAGMAARDHGLLSDEQLADIADTSLAALSQVVDRSDAEFEAGSLPTVPGRRPHFNEAVPLVDKLFARVDKFRPPTIEQDVARTELMLEFYSNGQEAMHRKFVDRNLNALIGDNHAQAAAGMWRSPVFLAQMGPWIRNRIYKTGRMPSSWPDRQRELFNKTFETFGLSKADRSDMLDAVNSYEGLDYEEDPITGRLNSLVNSLAVMSQLMKYGPEVPREIYKRFGIRNFHRYDARTLYDQLELFRGVEKGEIEAPGSMVLVASAISDSNNALAKPIDRFGAADPVYTEVKSLREVGERLLLAKKMAPISGLIINAHGDKNYIGLGVRQGIFSDELNDSASAPKLRDKGIFTAGADVLIMCCMTGQKDGLAPVASKTTGALVSASRTQSYGSLSVDPDKPEGYFKVELKVMKRPGNLLGKRVIRALNSTAGVTYKNGKQIRNRSINLLD